MRRRSQAAWAAILKQLDEYSGSQRQFCEDHDIGIASLRYHLARQPRREDPQTVLSKFVPIGPLPGSGTIPQPYGPAGSVELIVGPVRVRIGRDSDPEALRLALRVAVETCGPT